MSRSWLAIRRLQERYADIVSRRAWAELGEVFAPDVRIRIDKAGGEPVEVVGPEPFAAFVGPAMAPFDFFVFVILNAAIELDDDDADHGRSTMFMTELRNHPADGWSQVFGRYDDRFERRDGRWRFTERRYRTLARTTGAGPVVDVFGPPDR